MRYSEYLKKTTRLEKKIEELLTREIKASTGNGPWYVKMFPSLRSTTIEVANRKRGAVARERAKLAREMFADPSTMWNADMTAVFRHTVPSSPDAIERLRSAADAAFDVQQ